jgi:glucose/mannose-6-phosphate isomerase
MPTILDNRSKIKKLDSQNMLGSLELLGEQVKQMCKQKVTLPASYRKVKNVVVLGMGGSTLGSHVIKALYANTLTVPVDIINGYHVPASVSEHTLVIVSSYSGTTEEPVAAGKEALAKKAKVLTISSGGTLKT